MVTAGAYSARLPGGFAYEGTVPVGLASVEPASGTICGGEKVTLKGSGFNSSLQVRFGAHLAASLRVLGAGEAEVFTPSVPENVAAVAVGISVNGGAFLEKPAAFTFIDPRPLFIRGDADGDGRLQLSDAIAIGDFISGARASLPHLDAADANDDGAINTGDLVALTGFLFRGEGSLPPPRGSPGRDPTPDDLRGCP
jgi:hypothetical protein